jgi:membrane-bound ClpP family serine protease
MDPLLLIALLVVGAVVLLFGDLFIPSGGIMSVVGVGMLLTAVFVCFTINRWLGLATLFGVTVASPFVVSGMIKAWRKTPVGKKLLLRDEDALGRLPKDVVRVGSTGRTLSALRPMGEAEFEISGVGTVIQAKSELGDLPPDHPIRVIHFNDGVATVRPIDPVV